MLGFIATDARLGSFAQWSSSTVVDENTGEPVIDRALFDVLHAEAGITADFPVGNAGVIHVYGYWFSTALTPYGYKRDRWQNGELATVLGEPASSFHLIGDAHSTPLQRVTAATMPLLRDPEAARRPGLAWADARVGALDTRVVLAPAAVPSPTAPSPRALIYGNRTDGEDWQLVTTFPLAGDADAVITDFLADRRLRWNAALSPNL